MSRQERAEPIPGHKLTIERPTSKTTIGSCACGAWSLTVEFPAIQRHLIISRAYADHLADVRVSLVADDPVPDGYRRCRRCGTVKLHAEFVKKGGKAATYICLVCRATDRRKAQAGRTVLSERTVRRREEAARRHEEAVARSKAYSTATRDAERLVLSRHRDELNAERNRLLAERGIEIRRSAKKAQP